LLAGICFAAQQLLFAGAAGMSLWRKAGGLTVTIAVGAAGFFGAAYLLRVAEIHDVVELVQRRFSKARAK
jgi:hypothetical protein